MLSREEVRRALGAVRIPLYRACLTTIYACGLRLLEGAHLQVPDIDSDRMLHVLPRGCAKVRYYGIWSNSFRRQLEQARALLNPPPAIASDPAAPITALPQPAVSAPALGRCPHCRIGQLVVIEVLLPQRKFPP